MHSFLANPMRHFTTVSGIQNYLREQKLNHNSIGLVPTMGALHEGHSSLVKASLSENDITVTSIFINPVQFDNVEDFKRYPQTLESDLIELQKLGNTVVFIPSQQEMYPEKTILRLEFGSLQQEMEGKFREGHFNGVGIVVGKLFNIIKPDKAYFGQKDLQQYAVINQLVKDFSFDVKLRCMPILREDDGLAFSSRNQRLDAKGRTEAIILYKSLELAKDLIVEKVSIEEIIVKVQNLFGQSTVDLEYFEIVDPVSLMPIQSYNTQTNIALCIAGRVGKIRLIDNMIISK
ncbi:MAG: pantoate--beta-alanine ligase [Bacteroidota bacterium]